MLSGVAHGICVHHLKKLLTLLKPIIKWHSVGSSFSLNSNLDQSEVHCIGKFVNWNTMVIIVNFFPLSNLLSVKCICCPGTRKIGGSWECDESRYSGMGFFYISKKSHSKKVQHHYAFLSVLTFR